MTPTTTPHMPVATDPQEQAAQHRAAEKAADICISVLEGASTHAVALQISVTLMQFYHQGALDALDHATRKR